MKFSLWYAIAVLVLANSSWQTLAQDASCLNQLAPCLNYLNGTRDVPNICCDPLKQVIKNNPECLCRMISNKGSSQAEQAGIDVNEAQMLPARCGEHVNPIGCLTGAGGSRDSNQYSASSGFLSPSNVMKAAIVLSTIIQLGVLA